MRPLYATGDTVAVFDAQAGRWRAAAVIAVKSGRIMVATREWWGVVPTRRDSVRPIRVVDAREVAA